MNASNAISIAIQGTPVTRLAWKGTRNMVRIGDSIRFVELDGINRWTKACLLDTYDLMANDWVVTKKEKKYGYKQN